MRFELADGVFLLAAGRYGYGHPINCNVYMVVGTRDVALIDTGCGFGVDQILHSIEGHGVHLSDVGIAVHTHSHWDHARGAATIADKTGCRVAIHAAGVSALESGPWMEAGTGAPPAVTFRPAHVQMKLEEGDAIDLGGRVLRVIHTPGHTPDSICLELTIEGRHLLFSGDTAFVAGKPGIVTAESDLRAYRDSVTRLAGGHFDCLLPGHGLFVLSGAMAHIEFLARRLSGKWADVGVAPYPAPFESGVWFYQTQPTLLSDPPVEEWPDRRSTKTS